jgi:hypothetical protein
MRLGYKIFLSFLMVYCLHGLAYAQQSNVPDGQVFTIKGVIFRKNSSERISQALITDLKTQVVMMSDELGGFSIKAAVGDTLLISKNEYAAQKIVVFNAYELAINMQPVIQLNEVTIKGQTKKQELNEVMGQYRSQGTFYNGQSPPAWAFINAPLTGLYEIFGKTPGRARRFAAFSKRELETSEVNRRYTKALVKSATNLPDDEIEKFMNTFTPSFEDLKEWNDYQLITYIKKSLDYYQKHKDEASKLQKLY